MAIFAINQRLFIPIFNAQNFAQPRVKSDNNVTSASHNNRLLNVKLLTSTLQLMTQNYYKLAILTQN